jgi:hypothetical protein
VGDHSAWTGDVEPVPFPFRPGLVAPATDLGFDAGGEWLVVAGRDGVLHGLSFDGSPPEVLPRAFHGGAVLRRVEAILGVPDGVVVCGRLTPTVPTQNVTVISLGEPIMVSTASPPWMAPQANPVAGEARFVAAHYDRVHRRVTVHNVGRAFGPARWSAFPDLNCVAVRELGGEQPIAGGAVDLTSLGWYHEGQGSEQAARARTAFARADFGSPPHTLEVKTQWTRGSDAPKGDPFLRLSGNTVHVKRADPPWAPFEPRRDGKPALAGTTIHQARLAGGVLALNVSRGPER